MTDKLLAWYEAAKFKFYVLLDSWRSYINITVRFHQIGDGSHVEN